MNARPSCHLRTLDRLERRGDEPLIDAVEAQSVAFERTPPSGGEKCRLLYGDGRSGPQGLRPGETLCRVERLIDVDRPPTTAAASGG